MAAPAPASQAPNSQYLTFMVASEDYAIDLRKVREVMSYTTVTRVPMAPACIKGVVNVRGTVVPVVELSAKFGLGPTPPNRFTSLIVVEVGSEDAKQRITLSMLVDSVKQVMEHAASDVLAPPSFGTPIHADYLLGMLKDGERFVLLLDIERILSTEELRSAVALQTPSSAAAEPLLAAAKAVPGP